MLWLTGIQTLHDVLQPPGGPPKKTQLQRYNNAAGKEERRDRQGKGPNLLIYIPYVQPRSYCTSQCLLFRCSFPDSQPLTTSIRHSKKKQQQHQNRPTHQQTSLTWATSAGVHSLKTNSIFHTAKSLIFQLLLLSQSIPHNLLRTRTYWLLVLSQVKLAIFLYTWQHQALCDAMEFVRG